MNDSIIPIAHVLKTAAWINRLAMLIALIGVVASYGTQVYLLLAHEVGIFSYVIPATIDLLAICAALALQLPGLDVTSRKIAGWILTVTVVVSVTANVTGGHNTIARLAHAWPVVAYLFGELIANRVRSYAARLVAAEKAAAKDVPAQVPAAPAISEPEPVAAAAVSPSLPEAPVSPAISGVRKPYGGRSGPNRDEYSDRSKRPGRQRARAGE